MNIVHRNLVAELRATGIEMTKCVQGLAISVAICVLSGCVLSKATMEERTPELEYPTKGTLALTVIDDRPFVISGEKPQSVEGIFRDGYGIPHQFEKMRDKSDRAYTARISEVVSKAFYDSGSKVIVLPAPKGSTISAAIEGMRKNSFDRGLIIDVKDSRVDAGGFRWSYFFDYEVVVIGPGGKRLSTKRYHGEDVDFQRAIFHAGKAQGKSYSYAAVLDVEYKDKLSAFLKDRETAATLKVSGERVSSAAGADVKGDAAKRLAALKVMRDQGLITNEDYERKKAEILKSL